jgi:hypothetical protein
MILKAGLPFLGFGFLKTIVLVVSVDILKPVLCVHLSMMSIAR